MNQFRKNDRTIRAREAEPAGSVPRLIRFACSAVLCFAVIAGQAAAQQGTKPAKSKHGPGCSGAQNPGNTKSPSKGPCCPGGHAGSPSRAGTTLAQSAPSTAGDDAPRWACANPTIKLPPLWQGTPVSCEFDIRNEGKRDLKIKAQGG